MKKILHFHIPKTGGIAIQHHFVEQLGKERVSDTIVGSQLRDALVQFDYFDVISGHLLVRQGDRLPQDRCSVTVLRHPLDRFLSEYFYHKTDCADRPLDTKRHGLNLDAYLEQFSLNEQESLATQILMLYPLGTSSRIVLSLEEKFTAAVKAVESFELVGLQEELEDFACMLDAKFGWKYIPLKLKNVTQQRIKVESLSSSQLQKLHGLFARELELYQYAQSRFYASRREFLKRTIAVGLYEDAEGEESRLTKAHALPAVEAPADFGDGSCTIEDVSIKGQISGGSLAMVGEYFDIVLKFKVNASIDKLNASIAIKDERGLLMFSTNSMQLGHVYFLKKGEYTVRFSVLNRLPRGNYHVDVALMKSENHYFGCYHWREKVASFMVQDTVATHFEGHIFMDADVSLKSIEGSPLREARFYMASVNQAKAFGRLNKPLTQFESTIDPLARIENLFPDMDIYIPMRIENTGQQAWAAYGRQPVALAYRWLTKNGDVVVADGIRTRLPADVLPGMAVVIPMQISVPSESQSLQLVISLVQEAVAWFVDKNPNAAHVISVELG